MEVSKIYALIKAVRAHEIALAFHKSQSDEQAARTRIENILIDLLGSKNKALSVFQETLLTNNERKSS